MTINKEINKINHKKEYKNMYNIIQKPKYLRAKELATYLGIGKSTVWLYVKQGKIIKHKISAKVTLFDVYQAEKSLNLK
jgi:hypothetical protein